MKLSIILCTYNSNSFFDSQINSFLSQKGNLPLIELIISDDSEKHDVISKKMDNFCNDHDFITRLVYGPKSGSACLNFLSALALYDLGDWVFLSDQDDLWNDNKINKYYSRIRQLDNNKPQLIFSDASLIDSKGIEFCDSFYKYQGLNVSTLYDDNILFSNCVQGATICVNKKMIDLINESLNGEDVSKVLMHDWWIAILARYCGNWTFIDEPLLSYRQHVNNIVGAQKRKNIWLRIIKKPFHYLKKLQALKQQFELWNKVSNKLEQRSSFKIKKMSLNKSNFLIFMLMKLFA